MKILILAVSVFYSFTALADICTLTVNRTACPGKETEAYRPYGGENPTIESRKASTSEECLSRANGLKKILRVGVIKKIIVTPVYDGNSLNPVSSEFNCR